MAFLGTSAGGSRAAAFGSSVGEGLGKGLSALANSKLQSLQEMAAKKRFIANGYSPEEADILAMYQNNPQQQAKLLMNLPEREQQGMNGQQTQDQTYLEEFQNPQQQHQPYESQPQNIEEVLRSLQNPMGFAQARLGEIPQQYQQKQMQPQQMQQQPQRQLQPMQEQQPRQPQRPVFTKKNSLEDQLKQERIQSTIDASNKPYRDSLSKRAVVMNNALPALQEMMELLEKGDVQSGAFAGNVPAKLRGTLLTEDSDRFANLGDDVAEALAGLSTGVQTVSKINFNRDRKANLSQAHNTQVERVKDATNQFAKLALETDVESYLIQKNGGQIRNLSTHVLSQYNKLVNNIPDKPRGAEEGQTFTDPKTGARWTVQGPIMRFIGFKGEKNG